MNTPIFSRSSTARRENPVAPLRVPAQFPLKSGEPHKFKRVTLSEAKGLSLKERDSSLVSLAQNDKRKSYRDRLARKLVINCALFFVFWIYT